MLMGRSHSGGNTSMLFARLESSGTPDRTFDRDGRRGVSFDEESSGDVYSIREEPMDFEFMPSGKIAVTYRAMAHRRCKPGSERSCPCPDSETEGTRRCNNTGTHFLPCGGCPAVICEPGREEACDCAHGHAHRRCNRTGTAWSACDCPDYHTAHSVILMHREEIFEGYVAYTGRFPRSGPIVGRLVEIGLNTETAARYGINQVALPKYGMFTSACGDEEQVVLLNPGTVIRGEELAEIFGTQTPPLEVFLAACCNADNWLDRFPLQITYEYVP